RCAARNHSLDMAANSYFAHNNPVTNEGAGARIDRTGYSWSLVAENIAVGQSSPQQVVSSWMGSFGHCTNILEPSYVELGVGFYDAGEPYEGNIPGLFWTQNFGTPR
ncbi:MAG: CAP domain-containing protein, partial [Myxococcota bacterium]